MNHKIYWLYVIEEKLTRSWEIIKRLQKISKNQNNYQTKGMEKTLAKQT